MIIGEGSKKWEVICEDIAKNSGHQRMPSDRLSSVFVGADDFLRLQAAIGSCQEDSRKLEHSLASPKPTSKSCILEEYSVIDLNSANAISFDASRSTIVTEYLQKSKDSGKLLIFITTSLDETLDLIASLDAPVQQLTLLSPTSAASVSYVRDWVDASIFSVGKICPVVNAGKFSSLFRPVFLNTNAFSQETAHSPKRVLALSSRKSFSAEARLLLSDPSQISHLQYQLSGPVTKI